MSKFKEKHLIVIMRRQSVTSDEKLKLFDVIRKFIRAGGQNVD